MADVPVPVFWKYWTQMLTSLNSQCHAIAIKYPKPGTVVQVQKVLSDIEILAGCTPAEVGECSEWTSIVNSAKENRANFFKSLVGKLLFSVFYGMYMVTLIELKAVSAQAKHSDSLKKTSLESTAQDDDFWEVKKRRRHNSHDASQSAKNSNKTVPISAAFKLPAKVVSTCNFFMPLRTTGMDTETAGAENTLLEQEAPRKSGRPPSIVMTSTINLIQLQSDLKEHVKGEYEF
jgi:hypothetical protein